MGRGRWTLARRAREMRGVGRAREVETGEQMGWMDARGCGGFARGCSRARWASGTDGSRDWIGWVSRGDERKT